LIIEHFQWKDIKRLAMGTIEGTDTATGDEIEMAVEIGMVVQNIRTSTTILQLLVLPCEQIHFM